ncbi:MAG: hypothetical protein AAGD11_16025 [Planctomycetota bacterium]
MQHIPIADEQYQKLSIAAQAAGFADVAAFISSLAEEPTEDPRETLTDQQLAASAAECDASMAEFEDGKGRDAIDALKDMAQKRGYHSGLTA